MKTSCQEGRINQKRRTRATLLAAATTLVEAGEVPTIPEVADAAGISRATAYRYFSNQEAMLLEAMLERAMPEIDQIVRGWNESDGAVARLDQLVRTILEVVIEYDASFRAMLRASLDPDATRDRIRRGGRIHWLEQALHPVRAQFTTGEFDRLLNALTPYAGIEAVIVLCDIASLTPQQAVETACWASTTLLQSALSGIGDRSA